MIRKTLITALLAVLSASAVAAVSPEEAAQLGKSLTPTGAEKAGNKDGTIPEWTGGLTTAPAGFKPGSVVHPDPYAADKPRIVITGQNADQYKDKLTATTLALLKRYATMRVDVYPTRRPVMFPQRLVENTLKNATQAKTTDNGLGLQNTLPGTPFPIPKTGNEAMWNHLVRYNGVATSCKYESYNTDSSGVTTVSAVGQSYQEFSLYKPENIGKVLQASDPYLLVKIDFIGPARRAGEAFLIIDYVNPLTNPRKAWQYLPGQRRVKLAPELAYDTPTAGTAGATTYDDSFLFNGAMDRFDFKLVGKREMIVPYNEYKFAFAPGKRENVTMKGHVNPDLERWELHRVWVVEATLKPGKRHIYHKRVFYIDEDSWAAVASDEYDARGNLYKGGFAPTAFAYGAQAMNNSTTMVMYDMVAGLYAVVGHCGLYGGSKFVNPLPARDLLPDALAGAGVR
jgi:hypothetical protein